MRKFRTLATVLFIATLVIVFTLTSPIATTFTQNADVALAQQSADKPVVVQNTPPDTVKTATYVDFQIEKIYSCSMKKMSTPVIDVKKYGGKQIAIVKGKIVAADATTEKVLKSVRRKLPHATWRDILLVTVPEGTTVAYCV